MKSFNLIIALCGLLFFGVGTIPFATAADLAGAVLITSRVALAEQNTSLVSLWAANMENQLASSNASPSASVLKAALAEAEAAHARKMVEVERLQHELDELRAAVNQEKIHDGNLENQIDEAQAKLKEAKEELAALALQEAELMRKLQMAQDGSVVSDGEKAGGRKSIVITIKNNLLAPLAAPYFTGRVVRWTDGDRGIEISPAQDGVPMGSALAPGGWLAEALSEAEPEKKFIAFLVNSDSITTYYAVLKELRKQHYLHTWDTWNGKSFQIITQYNDPNHPNGSGSPYLNK